MRILYTSDIHVSENHLSAMLSAAARQRVDAIIIGGDLIPHGLPGTEEQGILAAQAAYLKEAFVPAIAAFRDEQKAAVYLDMGNDDFLAGRRVLEAHDGELFHLLHMRRHQLMDGVDIIGYMMVPPTPFSIKDWEKPDSASLPHIEGGMVALDGYVSGTGELTAARLDLGSADTIEDDMAVLSEDISSPFIFVSHCPPYNTPLDMLYNGQHVGSGSIRRFIESWSDRKFLLASLHGHIHESPKVSGAKRTEIGSAICINPGQVPGSGAELQYVLLELAGGSAPAIKLI